jgi:hypothetical protein
VNAESYPHPAMVFFRKTEEKNRFPFRPERLYFLLSGETEAGSAGVQPEQGYPDSRE